MRGKNQNIARVGEMKNGKRKQHGPYKNISMHVLSQNLFPLVNSLKNAIRLFFNRKWVSSVSCKGRVFAAFKLVLTVGSAIFSSFRWGIYFLYKVIYYHTS